MKFISFNINGLRARLHQLQALIDKHQPDVIGLQEIKVHDEAFPIEAVEAMGYKVYFHGQKAHYGVAMLCKQEPLHVQKGFRTDNEAHQKRMIMATFLDENGEKITVLNGYFPQGDNISHETKFPYKRQFYKDLMTYLNDHHNSDVYPEVTDQFSWFDYRSRGFDDNRGLRIDVILATPSLAQKCIDSGIDYELRGIEKPSDHAPIWSTFK